MHDIREEFEAWHLAKHGYITRGNEDLGEGAYGQGQCSQRWEVWQASRAALKVDLPECFDKRDVEGLDYDLVVAALQQAGIEVKP